MNSLMKVLKFSAYIELYLLSMSEHDKFYKMLKRMEYFNNVIQYSSIHKILVLITIHQNYSGILNALGSSSPTEDTQQIVKMSKLSLQWKFSL